MLFSFKSSLLGGAKIFCVLVNRSPLPSLLDSTITYHVRLYTYNTQRTLNAFNDPTSTVVLKLVVGVSLYSQLPLTLTCTVT